MDVLHPVILDENDQPLPLKWVTLPNGEPGHFLCMYNEMGEPTDDESVAYIVCALDRFIREWQYPIQSNTFEKPRFH